MQTDDFCTHCDELDQKYSRVRAEYRAQEARRAQRGSPGSKRVADAEDEILSVVINEILDHRIGDHRYPSE